MRLSHLIFSALLTFIFLAFDARVVVATDKETTEKYTGSKENNIPHGKGVMAWPDGRSYSGEWKKGKRHGYGTYRWPGGEVYRGKWQNNLWHGQGTYTKPDGTIMTGEWRRGDF